jgi:signal transduction histidine kinase
MRRHVVDDSLQKLLAVSDAALAHVSLEALLDELPVRVREMLGADTCAVLLLDEETGELVARAAVGIEEEVEQQVRIPVGGGFAGRIAAEQRPVVVDDIDHFEVVNPILRDKGIRSLVGAPLVVHGRVLGVIHAGTLTPRRFGPHDVELLTLAAERAAVGIERALLHDELVRLNELKDSFIAFASHELRTPAATIYGVSRTLKTRGARLSAEQQARLHEALDSQSERLCVLIDQLLDLSRLQAGAITVAPRPVRLKAQLERIVAAAIPGRERDVELLVPEELEATVDPLALERIVGNLVANAFRYGEPPVRVEADQDERELRLVVEDRGRGVPQEFVPLLFGRFSRSEASSAEAGSGAGLGLAIAREYADAHGARLRYEAVDPRGARFVLLVPSAS